MDELKAGTNPYHFAYMDIVGFATPGISAEKQKEKIEALNSIVKESSTFNHFSLDTLKILPTGDGMAIGFRGGESIEHLYKFAIEVHKGLRTYNQTKEPDEQIGLRIGLHTGDVYPITDIRGQPNVCGYGITLAQRVMDLGDTSHILTSEEVGKRLHSISDDYRENIMGPLGKYSIKHGPEIFIYNVFLRDENIGNRKAPRGKTEPSTTIASRTVKVQLELKDADSMMAHHKLFHVIENLSSEPIETIPRFVSGDTPKAWEDINLSVYGSIRKKI